MQPVALQQPYWNNWPPGSNTPIANTNACTIKPQFTEIVAIQDQREGQSALRQLHDLKFLRNGILNIMIRNANAADIPEKALF